MQKRLVFSGLLSFGFFLLCAVAVIPVAGNPAYQMNPTDQQGTVNAIVNERFTATAVEQSSQSATDSPSAEASITPVPTLTLMPTAIFEGSFGDSQNNDGETIFVMDVSQEVFEYYTEGWEQYWREDYGDAIDEFDEAIELEPDWAEAYFSRAASYSAQTDYDDSLDDMQIVSDLIGELDAGMLNWRVFLHNQEGNIDEAILDGERILAENPSDVIGLSNLAYAYFNNEQYQAAIDVSDTIFLYASNDLFSFELRRDAHDELDRDDDRRFDETMIDGIEAYEDDDLNDAIEFFEDAVDDAEDTSRPEFNAALANWNLALAFLIDGEEDDAYDALDKAQNAYPDMANIYYLRALAQFNADNIDEEEYLDNINGGIEIDPEFPYNYVFRALYREFEGDEELAIPDHWRYLQLRQSHILLWQNIDPLDDELSLPFFSGWQHRFIVEAEAENRLSVTASESGTGRSNVDALIVVLDPSGNPVASNDDEDTFTYDAEIKRFELVSDGAYTVIIATGTALGNGMLDIEIELDD